MSVKRVKYAFIKHVLLCIVGENMHMHVEKVHLKFGFAVPILSVMEYFRYNKSSGTIYPETNLYSA